MRRGAAQGVVAAAFEPLSNHPAWRLLEENGVAAEDEQIILRRIQRADGRGRAFINDQPVSLALLRAIGGALLEIHGQHDGRGFLTASAHRAMLDEFAGLGPAHGRLGEAWTAWRAAGKTLEEKRAARDAAAREADYLRHVVSELGALAPRVGEETELAERRARLMAAEKIADDLAAAQNLMNDDGLEGRLAACAQRLSRAADQALTDSAPLAAAVDAIDAALSGLMEATSAVEGAADALGADPTELEAAEERLFALRAAARKHGVAVDELAETLARAERALGDLDAGEAAFFDLEAREQSAAAHYRALAEEVSNARRKAGDLLDSAVARELEPLKLGAAAFHTHIEADWSRIGPDGADAVEFMVATNPGAAPGPLKTIASGGELSRFRPGHESGVSGERKPHRDYL